MPIKSPAQERKEKEAARYALFCFLQAHSTEAYTALEIKKETDLGKYDPSDFSGAGHIRHVYKSQGTYYYYDDKEDNDNS